MNLTHQSTPGEIQEVASTSVRDGSAEDAETASEALVPAQSKTCVQRSSLENTESLDLYHKNTAIPYVLTHCHNKRVERRALCDKLKGTKTMVAVQKWTSPGCQQGESDADSQSCDKNSVCLAWSFVLWNYL